MRILYDHQVFSLQEYGGITRVFGELVRYMNARQDVSTDVLLGFSGTKMDFRPLLSRAGRVIQPGGALFRRRLLNYGVNEVFSGIMGPLLGRYDIYHSTYYRFLPTIRARRRVATHHDCAPERFPQLFPDAGRIRKLKANLFNDADLILCVSVAAQADLMEIYGVPEAKTGVVHNGISPPARGPRGAEELRGAISEQFLLFVGARHSYKNFDGFLEVYARSDARKDYKVLALGGGEPSAEHRALVAKLGLANHIVFVPYASPTLLAEAYARAVLLVYPSLYEGFGMPPLEAASLGCLSLVAENSATREICGDAAFFFNPLDQDDFLRALRLALSGGAEGVRLLKHAQELARQFTWDLCGRKTLDAYARLL